jgi:hypothetical protein
MFLSPAPRANSLVVAQSRRRHLHYLKSKINASVRSRNLAVAENSSMLSSSKKLISDKRR